MIFLGNATKYRNMVLLAQQGDAVAFKEIFDATRQKLFSYTVARVGDREDALDIVQDVYVDLWRALGSFTYRSDAEFLGFLFLILKRKIIRFYKKHTDAPLVDEQLIADDVTQSPIRSFELIAQLEKLRPEFAEVLKLRYWSGLTFEEISTVLKVNINTAKVWHHRALKELAANMQEHETNH